MPEFFGNDPRFKENIKTIPKVDEPKMYSVIIHNDHFTTMEFVVGILISVFHKPAAEATQIMMDVHRKGKGVCGIYTLDIAATKVDQVHFKAKENGFPLKCSYEKT